MNEIIPNYIKKRAENEPWKFRSPPRKRSFKFIVVIPVYAEKEYLPKTLDSISKQKSLLIGETLIVVVINNPPKPNACMLAENQWCFDYLQENEFSFECCTIDAFSPGFELPQKHAGVGLARKIGIDLALKFANPKTLICSIDADTILAEDYLDQIANFFDNSKYSAAVVDFKHQKADDQLLEKYIRIYENFLKTTAQKIKYAGSPFGYPAVGSTMICTAETYAAIGGMSRKKAGEDFYFLQELAKYCGVDFINQVLVHPSPRVSNRVHLGTGIRMQQALEGLNLDSLYYPEKAFDILKQWLLLGTHGFGKSLVEILGQSQNIHPTLPDFLFSEKIERSWKGLQDSAPSNGHFKKQFFRWFDGLKTMRLLKYFKNCS